MNDWTFSSVYNGRDIQAKKGKRKSFSVSSLALILQHLEFYLSPVQLHCMGVLSSQYFLQEYFMQQNPKKDFHWEHLSKIIGLESQSEAVKDFLKSLSALVGPSFSPATQNFSILGWGMSPSIGYFYEACPSCGVFRYLHSFCYFCGTMFDVKKSLKTSLKSIRGKQPFDTHECTQSKLLERIHEAILAGNCMKYVYVDSSYI